jgi:carboxypeptidase Taq
MTTATTSAYADLADHLGDVETWRTIQRTIGWDQETMMPPAAAELRARQLETLSALVHTRFTDARVGELIAACEADPDVAGDPVRAANIRELRHDYDKATKLPTELVAELSKTASLGMAAWKDARAKNDFSIFLPWLEKTFELNRRKAECFGIPAWGHELYDALMDDYEPGMPATQVAETFAPLRAFTVELLDRVKNAGGAPDLSAVLVETPIEKQKAFSRRVVEAMGFDFNAGRMDDAVHPFCEGPGPGDTRITNRYRPDGWLDQLSSATHEAGHGMYEQGVRKADFFGLPVGEAVSLGVHESQSRMWENMVARSRPFWEWALPVAKEILGAPLKDLDVDTVFRCDNIVRPSFIRVEADEVTYNLHIMLRFDLERAMIAGDLACKDLPGVWNERMKSDFGLDVPDDAKGCLQDIHWSMGAVGYFHTYSLGNLYAGQLWDAMGEAMPDREQKIARGEFAPILQWLREQVHVHGRLYTPGELCEKATGRPLDSKHLMGHLERKVAAVYG